MRERGWGRIVSIASSGIEQPLPGLVRSNAARAALSGTARPRSSPAPWFSCAARARPTSPAPASSSMAE
jgi:hypothetical protein